MAPVLIGIAFFMLLTAVAVWFMREVLIHEGYAHYPAQCIYCETVRGVSEGVMTPYRDGEGDPMCIECGRELQFPSEQRQN